MTTFNGIIERIYIKKFRKFDDFNMNCGSKLTILAGQNGTQKTTLLGLLAHPFSMSNKNPEKDTISTEPDNSELTFYNYPTLLGHKFQSKFANKFKLDKDKESAGSHEYTLYFKDTSIGDNGSFTLESIYRDRQERTLRIWKKGSRASGDGYLKYPVIYLSLKRVTPIGEEKKITIQDHTIEDDDIQFITNEYNEILLSSIPNEDNISTQLDSQNKKQIISHPSSYGALTISAGQDNIGTILTAILSFKKLMKTFPTDYKGGLLFIDEIESTLYPAVQKKLIEKIIKYAKDYKLQVFCTTHSPTIIETALSDRCKHVTKVNYLKSIDNKISVETDLTYEQILAHLSLTTLPPTNIKKEKIRVYSEDNEARLFLKALLPHKYITLLDLVKINIGAQELIGLKNRKICEFSQNIILLDGDQEQDNTSKNILHLPGEFGPDRLLYDFLKTLQESDTFWPDNQTTGTYSKQICFMNFPSPPPNPAGGQLREFYKNWFTEQTNLKHWGSQDLNALKKWKETHTFEVAEFEKKFVQVYNYIAKKNKKDLIT
jgi:hypothetical protein